MTAEIAIINSTGVALAADSAMTIGKDRVWKNSNKLFHLAPNADVAIMIFGNGSHCGIPWEVLVKQYRREIGSRTLPKLSNYVEGFVAFLDTLETPHPIHRETNLYTMLIGIFDTIRPYAETEKGKVKRRQRLISELLDFANFLEESDDSPVILDGYTLDSFRVAYASDVKEILQECIDVRVTQPVLEAAIKLAYEASRRAVDSGAETGLVVAGYGDEEFLPVVHEICVDGAVDGNVRAWIRRVRDANDRAAGGVIMPFAQSDIAHLFVEGLMPEYLEYVEKTLKGTLDRKSKELIKSYVPEEERIVEEKLQLDANSAMTKKFLETFQKFRHKTFIQPMLRVVNSLPKEEMAALAEALVESTSLRRKMDSRLETVGGPVDVAIVSKADGFVWIKRKHYFDIELNTDFVQRRAERYAGEIRDED